MHHIIFAKDQFGRMTVHSATARAPLTDPLAGLRSEERDQVMLTPLSWEERKLVRAAKRSNLPPEQRQVVIHQILSERRENLLQRKALQMEEAVRLRRQDVIDHENMRSARHSTFLSRQAEEAARIARTTHVEPAPLQDEAVEVPVRAPHHGEWRHEEFIDPRLLRPVTKLRHQRHTVEHATSHDNQTARSGHQSSFLRKLAAEAQHEPDIIPHGSFIRDAHDDEQTLEEEEDRDEHGQEM